MPRLAKDFGRRDACCETARRCTKVAVPLLPACDEGNIHAIGRAGMEVRSCSMGGRARHGFVVCIGREGAGRAIENGARKDGM
jgi:hypothetical protein